MSQAVLFFSTKCPHSSRLLNDFPKLPSQVMAVDVHDARAARHLQEYKIKSVPSLLVLTASGQSRIFTSRSEIAQILQSAVPPQSQSMPATAAKREDSKRKNMREGLDPNGPFPEEEKQGGICGFDGACINDLQDMADSYMAPFAKSNSNEAGIRGGERPQFAGPVMASRPLMSAQSSQQPKQNNAISDEELNNRLQELNSMRETYDKDIESRNREQYHMNMAIRN